MQLLIQSKEVLQTVVPVTSSLKFEAIKPDLENAQMVFVHNEIGEELCDVLAVYSGENAIFNKALELARKAVAGYALADYLPKNSVNISGAGNTRSETEREKSAYRYQEENLIESYLKLAESSIELLLKHCEKYATELNWNETPQYTYLKSNHIPSADIFSEYVFIGNSRRVFKRLKPILETLQQDVILSNIGGALNTKLLEGGNTGKYLTVQTYIRQALANLAIAEAIPMLNVNIESGAIFSIASNAGGDSATRKASISIEQQSQLIRLHNETGNTKIKQLKSYLQAHATDIIEFGTNAAVFNPNWTAHSRNDPNSGGAKIF
jgi:hypothetical protein